MCLKDRLETVVRHELLELSERGRLAGRSHERIEVTSRIKECESAIAKLRIKEQGLRLLAAEPKNYTLRSLKDLVGVKVMVFPRSLLDQVNTVLRERFSDWTYEPFREGDRMGYKYVGYTEIDSSIRAEYQVIPMLLGKYWDVEHDAIYKPMPTMIGIGHVPEIKRIRAEVIEKLLEFESLFERHLDEHETGW